LQVNKLRMTHQRQVILEELRAVTSHPTADNLFGKVRQRLPKISLATVYRNLELLAESGVILKLETSGRQKRFDGNPRRHDHIRCLQCGRVADVPMDVIGMPDETPPDIAGFKVLGYRLEFEGLCPDCRDD
jgi:Fur family ferric uptake transcriptional regulator